MNGLKTTATALTLDSGFNGRLLRNENLEKYTSWRSGGPADRMYFPANREDLTNFLRNLPKGEPVFWMGLGSNLLVRDGGIRGTVINTRGCLKEMHITADGSVYAEAGLSCAKVARFCCDNGLVGAEFLAGIPGTMGGALRMNAGAFGGETWAIVETVDVVDAEGNCRTRNIRDYEVGYRKVKGPAGEWFLAANLRLARGDSKNSLDKVKELLAKRSETQPVNQPSCGSVFKNPEGDYAARLIEASGLKGHCIGGACVSEKHANFIVNTGKATSTEIETLINYVRNEVARRYGVELETEVCIIGEKDRPEER